MSKQLLKSARAIGFATLVSRFLGYFRDAIIAGFFGTSLPAQAFVVAFRIPNLWRDLLGEGAANAAFVPVFTEELTHRGRQEFWKLASILFYFVLSALLIITLLGILFSPLIVRLMAPGFIKDPDKFLLTIHITQALFPYLLLVGLAAYEMGVLNSIGHFSTPAWGPVFLNIAIILFAAFFCRQIGVWALVAGILVGGIAQFAIQLFPLFRMGFRIEKPGNIKHPGLAKIGKLLLPRILGTGVYQLNLMVDTLFSSLGWIVGDGAVAAIYYANRLIQLPLAVFGVSMATAALPAMSVKAAEKNIKELKGLVSFSLKSLLTVILPVAAGLIVLGEPLVRILFQRGKFDEYSTHLTAMALTFYSFGLFSYSGVKILVSSFYAMQDTKTPVKVSVAALVLNIILNFTL
ncbi:MAG: murein biosynthesis integral membrane protein MurJ, partial [Candidatus Omnitrophica bacterium]|nr:murein biosynthesis integral membrane protein MurJ [Candidatus Omnitrophota bacterium]